MKDIDEMDHYAQVPDYHRHLKIYPVCLLYRDYDGANETLLYALSLLAYLHHNLAFP